MDLRDYRAAGYGLDLSDTVTSVCPCGCNLFRTVIALDDKYEIAAYAVDVECLECNNRFKIPVPPDHPDFVREG